MNDNYMYQGKDNVDIVASGYEWVCPICETLNKEISCTEVVICLKRDCKKSFFTNLPEHCIGD